MAYNKLRREIATLLANEEKTPVAQADIATKLESFYTFEDDGGGLKQCKDWIAFRDAALRDRGELIAAYRLLRKLLVTLGGPVVDVRPVPVDAPDAQIQHPCDTPATTLDDFAVMTDGEVLIGEAATQATGADSASEPQATGTSAVDLRREFTRDVDPGDEGNTLDGYDERGSIDAFTTLDQQGR